jgi:hypothetical protein
MPAFGMLRRVVHVRTNVSEKRSASIIMVRRMLELGSTSEVTSNQRAMRRNTILQIPHSPSSNKTAFFIANIIQRSDIEYTYIYVYNLDRIGTSHTYLLKSQPCLYGTCIVSRVSCGIHFCIKERIHILFEIFLCLSELINAENKTNFNPFGSVCKFIIVYKKYTVIPVTMMIEKM